MLTSIVLVTYNKLDYTKQCIDSVRKHTEPGSYELIVVDNGSADGTAEWLGEQPDIRTIGNGFNAGFPKACNQGLAIARGELLLLLNNDTLVTANWLEGLKRALLSDPSVGAVGPVTNYASYWTAIPVPYRTMDEMEQFAASFNRTDPAKWEERVKLIGYCLLIRREAYEKTGSFDERFGVGNFEDDDYGLRLRLAGYKLLLCGDTFIHHYGSVSFGENSARFERTLADNAVKFAAKWGFHPVQGTAIRTDVLDVIEREVRPGAPLTFLEIGCGCGATLLRMRHRYPGSKLYGVERLETASRIAAACGIEMFRTARPEDWPIAENSLDGVLIGDWHALADTDAGWWARLLRKLKPGGWLLACFPNRSFFRYAKLSPELANKLRIGDMYTPEEAKRSLAQQGLAVSSLTIVTDHRTAEDEAELNRIAAAVPGTGREELAAAYFIAFGRKPAALQQSGDGAVSARPAATALTAPPVKEQNDVAFTGERLILNPFVMANLPDVYEEHLRRYELAGSLVADLHVLDAACGAGYGSLMLRDAGAASVTGIDIDAATIDRAKLDYSRDGVTFVQGDVLRLPFPDGLFDAVVSFETIEHIADGAAWIREAARVLKDDGLFIVSTPNRAVTNASLYFEEQPANPHHMFEYRTSELVGELLQEFRIEELYGQSWFDDSRFAAMRWLRDANGQQPDREAGRRTPDTGSRPIPFRTYKSSEPTYVIAVCRKKPRSVRR